MIPNTTLDYLDQFNKHFVQEKTETVNLYRDRLNQLEKHHTDIRDRILKATQGYLAKGYCDYEDRGSWGIMKPDRGSGESYDMPFENYLRGIACELKRPWVTLMPAVLRIPNTRACRVLSNPFLMVMEDGKRTWNDYFKSESEAPVIRVRHAKFDQFWFQGETTSQFKQAWVEWVRDNPDCRKVLKTGEYLGGNNV